MRRPTPSGGRALVRPRARRPQLKRDPLGGSGNWVPSLTLLGGDHVPKRRSARPSLPRKVLFNVYWHFGGGTAFVDLTEFNAQVRKRQDDVGQESWRPDEPVLNAPRVSVSYFGLARPGDMEYTRYVVDLSAGNGSFFTAGELLFKLHNAVTARLRDADHCHFEGLQFKRKGSKTEPPLYEMVQGS